MHARVMESRDIASLGACAKLRQRSGSPGAGDGTVWGFNDGRHTEQSRLYITVVPRLPSRDQARLHAVWTRDTAARQSPLN